MAYRRLREREDWCAGTEQEEETRWCYLKRKWSGISLRYYATMTFFLKETWTPSKHWPGQRYI